MKIQSELLKIKNLNPLQKLILGLILNESPVVLLIVGGYDKTCGEIGKLLGVSRARIKVEVERLQELGYITTETAYRSRKTNLTQQLKDLLRVD